MRPHLVAFNRIPHGGGFTVVDPLTNMEVYGINMEMLTTKVIAGRKANGMPVGVGLEDEIEQWVCAKYGHECEKPDPKLPRKRNLSVMDVLHGTKVLVSHFLTGSKFVSQEEANCRAEICSKCPMNLDVPKPCGGGGICQELVDYINSTVGERATPYDGQLNHCNICGCSLRAAVWYPLENQCRGVNEEQKEQFDANLACWKKCP